MVSKELMSKLEDFGELLEELKAYTDEDIEYMTDQVDAAFAEIMEMLGEEHDQK